MKVEDKRKIPTRVRGQSDRLSFSDYSRFGSLKARNAFSTVPRVHTRAEKYLTRYAAEASAARDRSAARARVPLLLGTISNWPQATIARGGRRTRTHACRKGPLLGPELQSERVVSET